ncbi:MAG: hypothetical protein HQK49_17620 [Oligoflexia bacterium]|nr:hypothetical protein [Oligoflexia bacterium]
MRNLFQFVMVSLMVISLSSSVFASTQNERCYQLSRDGVSFSKTPEELCVGDSLISLRTGLYKKQNIVQFNMKLVRTAKCMDCTHDMYAVTNPSNSIFNELSIKIDGDRDFKTGIESGKISIGKNEFFYVIDIKNL